MRRYQAAGLLAEAEGSVVRFVKRLRLLLNAARLSDAVCEEQGQAVVEYALMLAFVALAAVAGLTAIGVDVAALFAQVEAGFH